MPFSPSRLLRACAAAAALALLAVAQPAAAGGGGSVTVGRPFADPAPQAKPTIGQPIRFSCTGKYTPGKDASDDPYVGFLWQWGDGSKDTLSVNYPGTGAQTDEQTHTFAAGGTYTVNCYAYHGLSPFGRLLIHEDGKVKVRVSCPGEDPGPKKCAKGEFEAFSGFWGPNAASQIRYPFLKNLQLSISNDLKGKPRGVVTYTGFRSQSVVLPFKMKPLVYKNEGNSEFPDEHVEFKSIANHKVEGGGQVEVELYAVISFDDDRAYRQLKLGLTGLPAVFEQPGIDDEQNIVEFELQSRPEASVANVCTVVGASKATVKAGEQVAVTTLVQNQGPACLRASRLLLNVEVTGGTVVSGVGDRIVGSTDGSTNSVFTIGALGDGKGLTTSAARCTVVIVPDQGSTGLRVQVSVLDVGAPQDQLFTVVAPPDRVLCIPVIVPK